MHTIFLPINKHFYCKNFILNLYKICTCRCVCLNNTRITNSSHMQTKNNSR